MRFKICLIGTALALAACGSPDSLSTGTVENRLQKGLAEEFPEANYDRPQCVRVSETKADCHVTETIAGEPIDFLIDVSIDNETEDISWKVTNAQ